MKQEFKSHVIIVTIDLLKIRRIKPRRSIAPATLTTVASAAACSEAVVPHFLARAHCRNCCVGETNISHRGSGAFRGWGRSDHVDSLPHQMSDRKFQNCADSLPIPLCACVDECPRARATLPTSRHCKGGREETAAPPPPPSLAADSDDAHASSALYSFHPSFEEQ